MAREGLEDAVHSDEEEEMNDGWGPSLYNDEKGIKMTIVFTPLPPPENTQKRARKNAKPASISVIEYFHEDMPLQDVIVKILFTALKRDSLIEHSCLWHGQEPDATDSFSLSYTIPRRVTSPVRINRTKDFEELLHEATSKPPYEVKLYLVENKIVVEPRPGADDNESDEDGDDEDATVARKKKKSNAPSKEEVAQAKIIEELVRRYQCEDKQCACTPCYVAGPDAKHVHLTHMHLRTWAAAIDGKIDGVDLENPPNSKMFDPPNHQSLGGDSDTVSLLAMRRAAQTNSAPAITVNFPGFVDLLRMPQGVGLAPNAPGAPMNGDPPARQLGALPLPPMPLLPFCNQYFLSVDIEDKLEAIQISGPHVLPLISDADLRGEAKLSVGELASLRDAEMRWKLDVLN